MSLNICQRKPSRQIAVVVLYQKSNQKLIMISSLFYLRIAVTYSNIGLLAVSLIFFNFSLIKKINFVIKLIELKNKLIC